MSLEETSEGSDASEAHAKSVSISGNSRDRLTVLAQRKLSELDDSRLKLHLGDRTVIVKEKVDQILSVVLTVKDFVSSALTTQPMAALAWTGVCVLLPVSIDCPDIELN